MGYWTKLKAKYEVPDRSEHPWAQLLVKTLETADPELKQALDNSGELGAYIDMHIDDAMKRIRELTNQGTEYETAQEIAFSELFPTDPPEIEEYEEEGGQQDAIDAFSDWVDDRAG